MIYTPRPYPHIENHSAITKSLTTLIWVDGDGRTRYAKGEDNAPKLTLVEAYERSGCSGVLLMAWPGWFRQDIFLIGRADLPAVKRSLGWKPPEDPAPSKPVDDAVSQAIDELRTAWAGAVSQIAANIRKAVAQMDKES